MSEVNLSPDTLRTIQAENIRLRRELRDLKDELNQLRHAIRTLNNMDENLQQITQETDVVGLIYDILSSAVHAVNSEDGSLLLLDQETNELVFVEATGPNRDQLIGFRFPADRGIAGEVVTTQKPLLVPDVRQEPKWYSTVDDTIEFETSSLMCAPLLDDSRTLGVIEVVNTRSGEPFAEDDMDILLLVARLASLALMKAEEFEASS